ncbi:MAG: hypothetical protein PVF58_15745 [Candidatus Methanofastidiosia archaeon]|jgi:hypothetical protein
MSINEIRIIIYILSYVCAIGLGHYAVKLILRRFPLFQRGGLEGAGAAIGILERIFALTLVLEGQYTAIAIVLTVKSIARFEELKEREFAEYYLIGTLSSVLSAVFIGVLTLWVLSMLYN